MGTEESCGNSSAGAARVMFKPRCCCFSAAVIAVNWFTPGVVEGQVVYLSSSSVLLFILIESEFMFSDFSRCN